MRLPVTLAGVTVAAALILAATAEPGFDGNAHCAAVLCPDVLNYHGQSYSGASGSLAPPGKIALARPSRLGTTATGTYPSCGCEPATKVIVARIDGIDDRAAIARYPDGEIFLRNAATPPAQLLNRTWVLLVHQ